MATTSVTPWHTLANVGETLAKRLYRRSVDTLPSCSPEKSFASVLQAFLRTNPGITFQACGRRCLAGNHLRTWCPPNKPARLGSGSGESWFDPRRGNSNGRSASLAAVFRCPVARGYAQSGIARSLAARQVQGSMIRSLESRASTLALVSAVVFASSCKPGGEAPPRGHATAADTSNTVSIDNGAPDTAKTAAPRHRHRSRKAARRRDGGPPVGAVDAALARLAPGEVRYIGPDTMVVGQTVPVFVKLVKGTRFPQTTAAAQTGD